MRNLSADGAINGTGGYAGVFLLDIPFCADRMYDYFIPPELRKTAVPGAFVVVPFGGGNRRQSAVIAEIRETTSFKRTKPVLSVSADTFPLNTEQLSMCRYLAAQTLCTVGDAVRAVVPSGAAKSARILRVTGKELPPDGGELTPGALLIYEYIKSRGGAREELVLSHFGAQAAEQYGSLVSGGYADIATETSDGSLRYEKVYSLATDANETETLRTGGRVRQMKRKLTLPSQLGVIERLMSGETSEKELLSTVEGLTVQQLSTLVANGILNTDRRESFRDPVTAAAEPSELVPNAGQAAAVETLTELIRDCKPHAALLYGVTGSGKTTVILAMIDRMISQGRGVIVLIPEIALTPQMLGVFCSRYGERVAVMHSGLSSGERYDAYVRVRRGLADIVVGTRSAVFAPVANLGMLVIDEEQEHTYKSDKTPKYHARDVARKRCAENSALLLLASATPSVESFRKAREGVYALVRLTERYGNATLPQVVIEDMRAEAHGGNVSPLGEGLSRALLETHAAGEQSILFLNRRGYNTFISCADCGSAVKCPSCSVAMTYHTRRGNYEAGELVCHWCGKRIRLPEKCPTCGGKHLTRCGFGTQKVEQELATLMPDAKILRMDADTTSQKSAYDRILNEFRNGGDVLLGTQMVTKGHDFPRVTLVGVLLADMSLYLDDYRANERTFAQLTQVIGRAGRADRPGRAVIQTNNPDNDIIRLACAQDYDTFYDNEIQLRRLLTFPPFCDIVLLTVSHTDERELMMAAGQLGDMLKKHFAEDFKDVPQITFGPFEAPVYKVDDRFRMRFVIKCRLNNRSRELFSTVMRTFGTSFGSAKKPQLSVDFNPTNL